ncbi:hypothetical protein FHETE_6791 [Fusarium heterosporum]|uniref:Uncharacterized protein n=1 Tax=Fusarium heterosporum TaxID=42747 RepID=A0A8H5T9N2_FUSHE|nr:hypothetical protein FHETE_6791 [Fusarium heterosporum]
MRIFSCYGLALSVWAGVTDALAISEATKRRDAGYMYQPEPTPIIAILDDLRHLALAKRQTTSTVITYSLVVAPDSTCGFLSGSPGNAIKCPYGDICSWEVAYVKGVFCGSTAYNRCVDRSEALDTKLCDDVCQSNTYNLLCTDIASPFCGTYAYESGVRDFRCATRSLTAPQSVSFLYDDQDGRTFSTTFLADDITPSVVGETAAPSSIESSITSATADPTTTTSEAPEPQKTGGGGGSTNLGAIIGGAIGGFVALSLVVLGVIWYWRHYRKNRETPAQQPVGVPPPVVPQSPTDHVPPMVQHYPKSEVTSATQSDWRYSMATTQNPSSPVSNVTWMGQPPAEGLEVYHAPPHDGNYHR